MIKIYFILSFLLIGFHSIQSKSQILKPLCVSVGSSSEGWLLPGEENIIRVDRCTNKVVECEAVGTRSEGWYIYEKQKIELMEFSDCENNEDIPQCVWVNTPYEGWVVAARGLRIYYGKCSEMGVECLGLRTPFEGWYIFDKKPLGLLKYQKCSL